MLVLTRKHGERIKIGDNIYITVFTHKNIKNSTKAYLKMSGVQIGIEAPKDVMILREELINGT